MKNRNTIQDELNSLNSELSSNADGTPYQVPQGYFEGLAASVLAKVKNETPLSTSEEIAGISPLLAGISKHNPYSVPDNYFQSTIETLPAFTTGEEESLLLSFVEKEMPYEVPAGYFANLPEQILERVQERGAKVVPLMKRKWMRLAVAAMVAGVITISGIAYFNNKGVQMTGDAVPTAIKKASTEELNQFIESTDVSLTESKTPLTAKNTSSKKEAKQLFNDVSDKELENFLDQLPTEDEVNIN